MNFWKKQVVKNVEDTPQDKKFKELLNKLHEVRCELESLTAKCYIRNIAISFYCPTTPDWKYQNTRAEEARYSLIVRMGEYDDIRQQCINAQKDTSHFINYHCDESHLVVEQALYRIMWH